MRARHDTLKALRLRDLMPHHVAEVLLVSAPYEAFILEQDGQLTEQVFLRYSDLHLPIPPRFTHATSGDAAIELLDERPFDLVITMTSLADADPNAFGRRVKKLHPELPVVLLALDRKALHALRDSGVRVWNDAAVAGDLGRQEAGRTVAVQVLDLDAAVGGVDVVRQE